VNVNTIVPSLGRVREGFAALLDPSLPPHRPFTPLPGEGIRKQPQLSSVVL